MTKCNKHNREYGLHGCNNCLLEYITNEKIDLCLCEEIDPKDKPCIVCDAVDYRLLDLI